MPLLRSNNDYDSIPATPRASRSSTAARLFENAQHQTPQPSLRQSTAAAHGDYSPLEKMEIDQDEDTGDPMDLDDERDTIIARHRRRINRSRRPTTSTPSSSDSELSSARSVASPTPLPRQEDHNRRRSSSAPLVEEKDELVEADRETPPTSELKTLKRKLERGKVLVEETSTTSEEALVYRSETVPMASVLKGWMDRFKKQARQAKLRSKRSWREIKRLKGLLGYQGGDDDDQEEAHEELEEGDDNEDDEIGDEQSSEEGSSNDQSSPEQAFAEESASEGQGCNIENEDEGEIQNRILPATSSSQKKSVTFRSSPQYAPPTMSTTSSESDDDSFIMGLEQPTQEDFAAGILPYKPPHPDDRDEDDLVWVLVLVAFSGEYPCTKAKHDECVRSETEFWYVSFEESRNVKLVKVYTEESRVKPGVTDTIFRFVMKDFAYEVFKEQYEEENPEGMPIAWIGEAKEYAGKFDWRLPWHEPC